MAQVFEDVYAAFMLVGEGEGCLDSWLEIGPLCGENVKVPQTGLN